MLSKHLLLEVSSTLTHDVLHLFAQVSVVADSLLYGAYQVGGIVEETSQACYHVLQSVHLFLDGFACDGFYATHASCHAAFGEDAHHADAACAAGMAAAAELNARTELYDAHLVAVLLAEEGDSAQLLSFLDWRVAIFLKRQVLTDALVDEVLHLADLFGRYLLEVREVETQVVGRYE